MSNSLQTEVILIGPIYGTCLNILPFYYIRLLRIVFTNAINIASDSAYRKKLFIVKELLQNLPANFTYSNLFLS